MRETWGDDYDAYYAWQEWHQGFICEHCNVQMDYAEGTIDQDQQGNNIDGYWHYCPKCGECTEVEEL